MRTTRRLVALMIAATAGAGVAQAQTGMENDKVTLEGPGVEAP